MKVMFVIATMNKGGAERVVSNLANYLVNNGNQVNITTILDKEPEYELDDRIVINSTDSKFNYNNSNIINKINKTFNRIKIINMVKKQFQPDIVIAFMSTACNLVLASNFLHKTKTIISVRNDPKILFNTKVSKLLMKILYPKTDGIVFQTEEARDYFKKSIKDKGVIIPNPINLDFIGEKYNGIREKTIVSVGRLDKQKNQKLLIDAFNEVQKIHPDYTLKIFGEGELRSELEKQIDNLKLNGKVLLLGKVDNIKDEIKSAGMFVLVSLYEGMPNSLMEAMALGIPCISTDCPCGGPKFLIENNRNGILIKNNDKEELVNSIKKVIENGEFAQGLSQQAHKICDTLHPDKINKLWENYIENIREG